MRLARFSIAIFGALAFVTGTLCLISPQNGMDALSLTGGHGLRVMFGAASVAALNVGIYYMLAAYKDVRAFYGWTILPRLLTCALFGTWYSLGYYSSPLLLSIGLTEAAGAILTALGVFWLDRYSEDIYVTTRSSRGVEDLVDDICFPGVLKYHSLIEQAEQVPTAREETTRWNVCEHPPLLCFKVPIRYTVDQTITYSAPERVKIRSKAKVSLGLVIDSTITVERESESSVVLSEHFHMTASILILWLTHGTAAKVHREFLNDIAAGKHLK
jgi:hypothetical protein